MRTLRKQKQTGHGKTVLLFLFSLDMKVKFWVFTVLCGSKKPPWLLWSVVERGVHSWQIVRDFRSAVCQTMYYLVLWLHFVGHNVRSHVPSTQVAWYNSAFSELDSNRLLSITLKVEFWGTWGGDKPCVHLVVWWCPSLWSALPSRGQGLGTDLTRLAGFSDFQMVVARGKYTPSSCYNNWAWRDGPLPSHLPGLLPVSGPGSSSLCRFLWVTC